MIVLPLDRLFCFVPVAALFLTHTLTFVLAMQTFLRWCNYHLKRKNSPEVTSIDHLVQGENLLALVASLVGKPTPQPEGSDRDAIILQVFRFLEVEANIRMVNFAPSDLSQPSPLLSFLWTLVVRFHVILGDNKACPKKSLLNWCNKAIKVRTPLAESRPRSVPLTSFSQT
jgi:hypothetical protein